MFVPDNIVYLTITSAIGLQAWIVKKIFDIETKLAIVTTKQEMKTNSVKKALAIVALAIVPSFFIGCSTVGQAGGKIGNALSDVMLRGVDVITKVTNVVGTAAVTEKAIAVKNDAGLVVTNLVSYTTNMTYATNIVLLTNTVYESKPAIANVVDTVKAVAPFIPPPYGTVVDLGLTGITLLAGWLANKRNAQKQSLETQLTAVVQGVEKSANQFGETAKVKAVIADVASNMGVTTELHKFIQSVT